MVHRSPDKQEAVRARAKPFTLNYYSPLVRRIRPTKYKAFAKELTKYIRGILFIILQSKAHCYAVEEYIRCFL